MNCPYCEEPVNDGATVCKTCHRDFKLVLTLQEEKEELEERVEELEAELAGLRGASPTESMPTVEAEPPPPNLLDSLAIFVLVPIVVLIGAHYLLVIQFDAKLAWLRAVSIAVPALFGFMLESKHHPRWFVTLGSVHIEKVGFSQGALYVQAGSDAGLDVAAYYQGLLLRPIDANGYRYWTNAAVQGASSQSIGAAFQGSAEYANSTGKLGNAAYVDAVYQHMLHRPADAAGAAYWTQQLNSGAETRAGMVVAIEHSPEYAGTQLVGTFNAINDLGNLWS